jgi:hypothetical protein
MQTLYLDNRDGAGTRDFTKFFDNPTQFFRHEKNLLAIFEFDVVDPGGVPGFVVPQRGAHVRFEDSRWLSRDAGVPDGVVFTGYVVDPPDPVFLGVADGAERWMYHLKVTSDDYLANTKALRARTFINKSRGFILKELLRDLFPAGSGVFPFDVTGIHDGGIERIFQVDTSKKWSEVAAQFAAIDGYVYRCLDGHLFYQPQQLPISSDPLSSIYVDKGDPRFDPSNFDVTRVGTDVANDVTVFGLEEPSNIVRETFVSDGYQGTFPLSTTPYGITELTLVEDDFTDGDVNSAVWQHADADTPFIQPFEGSLNVIGGPGVDTGQVYLRSRKGVELSGFIDTRDGEIFFPPGATGRGVIGGLYTEDTPRESNIWTGWYIDLTASTIQAMNGASKIGSFALNKSHHYILRRHIQIDSTFRSLNQYVAKTSYGTYSLGAEPPPANGRVTWFIEEINDDDPANVVKTTTMVADQIVLNVPSYVLYAPIVPYDCHLVMNFVSVAKPSQIGVTVNGSPIVVGNYIDGGRCKATVDGGHAQLNWYGVNKSGSAPTDNVTIPPQRSVVQVWYYQSQQSSARVVRQELIDFEKQRFHDDGVRQLIIHSDQATPAPRNSEECQFLAQAKLADLAEPRYEGSYKFQTSEEGATRLQLWPCPGDLIPAKIHQADGTTVDTYLDVTSVQSTFLGKGAYEFSIGFGPINRYDAAERALYFAHKSSFDDPSIEDVDVQTVELLNAGVDLFPADPSAFVVGNITTTTFGLTMTGPITRDIAGYEVRSSDTGWGQGGYVLRTGSPLAPITLQRPRRDVTYFVRPFTAAGIYSRRSARVRVVYPLANNIVIPAVDGVLSPEKISVDVTLPTDPDFAGIRVIDGNSGTILYEGDGIDTLNAWSTTTAIAGSGRISIDIPNPNALRSIPLSIRSYDIVGQLGPVVNFTLTKNAPVLDVAPFPITSAPDIYTWHGVDVNSYVINQYGWNGDVESTIKVPPDINSWNFGDWGGTGRTVEVEPWDDWGQGLPKTKSNNGDTGTPSAPTLSFNLADPDAPLSQAQTLKLFWTVPAQNAAGLIEYQVATCSDPNFPNGVPIKTYYFPAGQQNAEIFYPGSTTFVKIRGTNDFGPGVFSNTVGITTPDSLDAIAPQGGFDYDNPTFGNNISFGDGSLSPSRDTWQVADGAGRGLSGLNPSGQLGLNIPFGINQYDAFSVAQSILNRSNPVSFLSDGSLVSDGSFRGRTGLDGNGFVNLNLPNFLSQFDPFGTPRTIVRNDMSVSTLVGGADALDGAARAHAGLNSGGGILQNIPFGILLFDVGGSARTMVHNAMNVSALANGATIETGGFRALAAINGSNFIANHLVFGLSMFDGGGSLRNLMNAGHSIQLMVDGGFAFTGANRAFTGFDGGGNLITGMIGTGGVFYSVNHMHDGIMNGRYAIQALTSNLDGGPFRIVDNEVDGFSIFTDEVAGLNIRAAWRAANNVANTSDGMDRHRI